LRDLPDRGSRGLVVAILAFMLMTLIANLKGVQIDFDPINIYFWLFAGVMFRLRYLEPGAAGATMSRASGTELLRPRKLILEAP